MTCVVAIVENNKIIMGADSCASDSNTYMIAKNTKIFIKNDFIIGGCDSFRILNILQYLFYPPQLPSVELNPMQYMVTKFVPELQKILEEQKINIETENLQLDILVGFKTNVFEVQSDFSVVNISDYGAAIGSGGEAAKASLITSKDMSLTGTERVMKALQAAEALVFSVRGPFEILEI